MAEAEAEPLGELINVETGELTTALPTGTEVVVRIPDPAHEIAVAPEQLRKLTPEIGTLMAIALQIAQSGMIPDTQSQALAFIKMLYGAEIGIGPISSVVGIKLINGMPTYSAAMMATCIARSKTHRYRLVYSDKLRCEIDFFEGAEKVGTSTWTIQEAQDANLTRKDNWRYHPADMLYARALSRGFRRFCAALTGGAAAYLPDELGLDGEYSGGGSYVAPSTSVQVEPVDDVPVASFGDEDLPFLQDGE